MKHARRLLGVLVVFALVLASCTSGDDDGTSTGDVEGLTAQLEQAQADLAAAQGQLEATPAVAIVETGELAVPPEGTAPSGWETEEAIRGGMSLLATYDSSGPDAWDVAAHPLVFFTSEGVGKNPLTAEEGVMPGFFVIDAYTKEVVASGLYEIGPMTDASHGTTVSPDGQWVYFGTGVELEEGVNQRVVMVVNARTLKLDTVLAYPGSGFVHHMAAWTDPNGEDRVMITVNRCPQFILDPNDDQRVVRTITGGDVPLCGHTYPVVDRTGQYFYETMDGAYYGETMAGLDVMDLLSDERGRGGYQGEMIWGLGEDGRPIGIATTADGTTAYVAEAHHSLVYKVDLVNMEVVDSTSAGVAGPYGVCLNWDESMLYVIGKGEGSHNHGAVVGVVDTVAFRQSRELHNMPIWLGGSASSVDHCTLHPDPEVNELWISNMNGWEMIVLDLETHEVSDYIATPNGGDTHSGAFVEYDAAWNGTLLADIGGPKNEVIWQLRDAFVAERLAGG